MLGAREDNIKLAIKLSIAKEMMIGGVVEVNIDKAMLRAEMLENGSSRSIIWINVAVST